MFPALKEAWRELRQGFGSTPEPLSILDTKTAGLTFDTVNADWYARNGYQSIYAALSGGMPAWSGETVSIDSALNHSVVWACNRIISESVAFMPLSLMQETARGKYPANGSDGSPAHPVYNAIHNAPNDEMTSMGFRETLTSHVVLGGNGYSQILRRSGTGVAMEFNPLMPSQVSADREKTGQKRLVYVVKDGNSQDKTYTVQRGKPQDILHIRGLGADGIRGYSVITMARQSIGTAVGGEKFAAKFWAGGGRAPYTLKLDQKFKTTQEEDRFREDWESNYSQPHKVPILYPNVTYTPIGVSLHDCQLLESRQFSIPEICRWFLISPHLVGDLSRATFCLPGDTEVYTDEGPRRIDQMRVGDQVWSRGTSGWVLSTVSRSGCTGYDEILTIKTTNRTLRLNAKHRVLARVKRLVCAGAVAGKIGAGQHPVAWTTEWVPAGELETGDTIVNLQSLPEGGSTQLPSGKPATVEFLEFCGLLAGDGNITMVKGEPVGVQIARHAAAPYMDHYRAIMRSMTLTRTEPDRSGENHPGAKLTLEGVEGIRRRLAQHESSVAIAKDLGLDRSTIQKIASGKLWGKAPGSHVKEQPSVLSEQRMQTRFRNVVAARELHLLGLGGIARTKRVPGWVFGLTAELRAAYVRGFLDADGSVDKKGRISFSSCNPEMLSQVRHLCMGLGVPVTNQRLQIAQTKLPNGRIAEVRQYAFTCSDPESNLRIGSHTPIYVERMRNGKPFDRKARNYPRFGGPGFSEEGCELARISSIERSAIHEPVYDLEVEGTHSFIADGVVVHNSNIEQLALEFVKMTLTAWITRWEQELWRCVLTPEEKSQGYYFKHNVNGLLRGDFASRMLGYASALQNGHLNVDEVRDLEDRNRLPDGAGEAYHIQLNMAPLPDAAALAQQVQQSQQDQSQPQSQSPQLVRLTGKKPKAA